MEVFDDIIQSYIKKEGLAPYKSLWFYQEEGYSFYDPDSSNERIEIIKRIYQEIQKTVLNFIPANIQIWDALFKDWHTIINHVKVNLIIGYSEPNDATVMNNLQGDSEVIFDLGCWVKYYGKCNISEVVHNLLTHELCHVCINKLIPNISEAIESNDYVTNLDANTFHEGFAHLVSYNDKNIDEVDWNSEQMQLYKMNAKKTMKEAFKEENRIKQKDYLYKAIYGSYYDKYACMASMFFLADVWKKQGVVGLEKVFGQGYIGFAGKTVQ